MFVRSPKGGRTAALLISGLLAALFLTGSASPRTTYHITDGETVRSALAAKAFVNPAETRKPNRITLPRIEEAFTDRVAELEGEIAAVKHLFG